MLISCSAPEGVVFGGSGHPFLFFSAISITTPHISHCQPQNFLAGRSRFIIELDTSIQSLTQELLKKKGDGTMKDLILEIVKALVDQPDRISVTEIEGSQTNVLELSVAKRDMGKIIGRKGRNAEAIRTILSAASGKSRKRHVLEIVEH